MGVAVIYKTISIFINTAGHTLKVSAPGCATDEVQIMIHSAFISPWGYLTFNPKLRRDSKLTTVKIPTTTAFAIQLHGACKLPY